MKISLLLNQKFKSARKGKRLFSKIYKTFPSSEKNKTTYLIFCEHDEEINHFGLLYLDEFLLRNDFKRAVIIASELSIKEKSRSYSEKIVETVILSENDMNSLISYYSLPLSHKNVRLISLDKPEGRRGSNLLGKNGLSKEKMIAIGVYNLIPFKSIETKDVVL